MTVKFCGVGVRFFVLSAVFSLYAFGGDLFLPIPKVVDYDKKRALLGKKLFFDPILSKDNSVSCANCHNPAKGGADGLSRSVGVGGKTGELNAPTILNSRFNIAHNWSGSAKSFEQQAVGPISNPLEMGHSINGVVAKLKAHGEYKKEFERLYRDGVTPANTLNALSEYEKSIITPDAAFDRYLRGDAKAMSVEAKKGFELFKKKGCVSCHNGVNIGSNMYQKIGVVMPYRDGEKWVGRYAVTKDERDRYFMKVPTLRNITLTAPYFHDGSVATLEKAVELMIYHQLGEIPKRDEVALLVSFLKSLEGSSGGFGK